MYVYICIYIIYSNNIVTPIIHVVVILKDNHKKKYLFDFLGIDFFKKTFFYIFMHL